MVYLPTWMVYAYGKCRYIRYIYIYYTWSIWVYGFIGFVAVRWILNYIALPRYSRFGSNNLFGCFNDTRLQWCQQSDPICPMYGISTCRWLKMYGKCRKRYHTWILWFVFRSSSRICWNDMNPFWIGCSQKYGTSERKSWTKKHTESGNKTPFT